MKIFLKKIFFFVILIFGIHFFISTIIKGWYIYKLDSCKTIILGDSQTEFIKLPSTLNHSIAGCPYFVHYAFVKANAKHLKNKKVFVALNYHNFSDLYENRFRNDSIYPGWREYNLNIAFDYGFFPEEYHDLTFSDRLNNYNPLNFKSKKRLVNNLEVNSKRINNAATFKDTEDIYAAFKRHWKNDQYILKDKIQNKYLIKIIELLHNNDNEVILLKMPLNYYYYSKISDTTQTKLFDFANQHRIRILDLHKDLNLSKEEMLFKDYGHLNIYGDSIVNNYIKKMEF